MSKENNCMPEDFGDDMNGKRPDNKNPHPSAKDPLEVRIRRLIREQAYATPEGEQMWRDTKAIQLEYFQDALAHLNDPKYVHNSTQNTLERIARATNAHIVDGREYAEQLDTPALVVFNHYSGYKLTALKPDEIDADFGDMEELYPFPSFYAPLFPVAKAVGDDVKLYDAHLEYGRKDKALPLRRVQEEAGILVVPEKGGSFETTLDATKKMIEGRPRSLIVVFPEGQTSGKRNNGTPYDMLPFRTGAFAIAAEAGIPVLPVVQYFNPNKGFEIVVLPPLKDLKVFEKGPDGKQTQESRDYYENLANTTHDAMQSSLNVLSGSVANVHSA